MSKHPGKVKIFLFVFVCAICVMSVGSMLWLWVSQRTEKSRSLASDSKREIPPGLTAQERLDFWHLSQGSEFVPYAWVENLTNFMTVPPGTPFLSDLDEKFGAIPSPA